MAHSTTLRWAISSGAGTISSVEVMEQAFENFGCHDGRSARGSFAPSRPKGSPGEASWEKRCNDQGRLTRPETSGIPEAHILSCVAALVE